MCPREIVIRVVTLRKDGLSYGAISAVLNREGVPTPAGRPVWHKSYVDRLLHTRYASEIREMLDNAPGGRSATAVIPHQKSGTAADASPDHCNLLEDIEDSGLPLESRVHMDGFFGFVTPPFRHLLHQGLPAPG